MGIMVGVNRETANGANEWGFLRPEMRAGRDEGEMNEKKGIRLTDVAKGPKMDVPKGWETKWWKN